MRLTLCAVLTLLTGCEGESRVSAGIHALAAGDATQALAQFDAAAAALPREPIITIDRGVALEKLRRHDEAISAFEQALALDDGARAARIHYDLGTTKARSGRSVDGLRDLRLALRLDPRDGDARHNLELLLQSRTAAAAVASTGLGDHLGLGHPALAADERVVLRARITPDPRVDRLERYWVGHFFDRFDGREWSNTGTTRPEQPSVSFGPSSASPEYQQVELVRGYTSTTLVGLESPVLFGEARAQGGRRIALVEKEGAEVRLASGEETPIRYQVESGVELPRAIDESRWKGLPAELDSRVGALAAIVIAGERDPAIAGTKLIDFLRRDYRYTLEGADPFATDPLAEFLFVRRAGHCEEFATAVAVMLRTQGFATRAVSGFSGGDRVGNHYELRCSQAHAWAQVFSPERGWVNLDATPEGPTAEARGKSQPLTKREANSLLDRVDDPAKRILRWPGQAGSVADAGVRDW